MKQLMLIFIGIFSFFSCFAMEESIHYIDSNLEENAIICSIFEQMNVNFGSKKSFLHNTIEKYNNTIAKYNATLSNSWSRSRVVDNTMRLVDNTYISIIKKCLDNATLDTVAYANYYGLFKLAKILIEHGALDYKLIGNEKIATTPQERRLTLNIQNPLDGTTVLYNATHARDKDFMLTLLIQGADPNIADNLMVTALMVASAGWFLEGVKLLLAYDADVERQDSQDKTALFYVSQLSEEDKAYFGNHPVHAQQAIAHQLVAYGAALNAKDKFGKTPLQYAAFMPRLDMVQVLLKLGALKCLSTIERALILQEAQETLAVHEGARTDFEEMIRGGNEVFMGYHIKEVLKSTNVCIKIFKSILKHDSLHGRSTRENTALRRFLLERYRQEASENVVFSVNNETDALPVFLRGTEINGNRGIKRGGIKRLRSAYEEEDVSYIVNYPRESSNSEEKNDTESQEPKRKERRK